jgi:hypothetical protein
LSSLAAVRPEPPTVAAERKQPGRIVTEAQVIRFDLSVTIAAPFLGTIWRAD